ncbi:MAG: hypothetical protein ISS48_02495 [Candidatus Aenigmarchaeota archaeon]|nr:hypothetical protein [Candidatus Aenigmarchaeota archaeon]
MIALARTRYDGGPEAGFFLRNVEPGNRIYLPPQTGIVEGDTVYMYLLPGEFNWGKGEPISKPARAYLPGDRRVVGLWPHREGLSYWSGFRWMKN